MGPNLLSSDDTLRPRTTKEERNLSGQVSTSTPTAEQGSPVYTVSERSSTPQLRLSLCEDGREGTQILYGGSPDSPQTLRFSSRPSRFGHRLNKTRSVFRALIDLVGSTDVMSYPVVKGCKECGTVCLFYYYVVFCGVPFVYFNKR